MRYWVKLYTEIVNDPKMGRLTDRQFRTCINLFALAGELDQDGALPDAADLAWRLRLQPADLTADLEALAAVNILTATPAGWSISKWTERQAKAPSAARDKVLQRVHDYRERERNESVTTLHSEVKRAVTPPEKRREETEKIQSREEQNRDRGEQKRAAVATAPTFEAFQQARGGAVNPMDGEQLGELENLYGSDTTVQAIKWCNEHKDRPFLGLGYIAATLAGWQRDGGTPKSKAGSNGKAPIHFAIDVGSERIYYRQEGAQQIEERREPLG